MNKLIVILGPTASGKTDLSIKLAKKYNCEIISADSRQIYNGLNIGSGKITEKEMQGIPHHLLSVANPKRRFTIAQYQKLALKAIRNIQERNKVPILVGGTGFYIQSVVDGIIIPKVKPDCKLRKMLEKKSNEELFSMLNALDPGRAKNVDKQNPRRLIRALEIISKTKKTIPPLKFNFSESSVGCQRPHRLSVLQIGVTKSSEELKKLINKRLIKRLQNKSLINEVKKLHKFLSWKRLEEFGLEYRFVAQYLQNKITYQQMTNNIQKGSEHYAKRQMTWFKRDHRIIWVANSKNAQKLVKKFL
jgi:tRNA dimethylallyltransferase